MSAFRKFGRVWYYRFTNEHGRRVERKGCADRRATEGLARAADSRVAKIRAGEVSAATLSYVESERAPLQERLAAFEASMNARGKSARHVRQTRLYVERIARLAGFNRLSELDAESVLRASSD
jgi:hypothetical protein